MIGRRECTVHARKATDVLVVPSGSKSRSSSFGTHLRRPSAERTVEELVLSVSLPHLGLQWYLGHASDPVYPEVAADYCRSCPGNHGEKCPLKLPIDNHLSR